MNKDQINLNTFDAQGFRFNVGIIISNARGELFWGKRKGQYSWQFPQGGVGAGESSEQAMWRELYEETGLQTQDVEMLAVTRGWLKYRLPMRFRRRCKTGMVQCIGQKQKWFLLRLLVDDDKVNLATSIKPEFDDWRWIDYWSPGNQVVHFKRRVYQQALEELSSFLAVELPQRPQFRK